MAFSHEPLDEATVGPEAWRVAGPQAPAAAKKLAANGLAPLPPRAMLVALYQLWVTPAEGESGTAAKTVEGLPPTILAGALGDRTLPAGVLDLLGRKFPRDESVLVKIVGHPNADDETLVGIGRHCPEATCDLLADNQARWLQAPRIVESLYQNPHCRMSVAQRMVELAVREGVELALPNIDEIKQAIGLEDEDEDEREADDASDDDAFRNASTRVRAAQYEEAARVAEAGARDEVADIVLQSEEDVEAEASEAETLLKGKGDDEPEDEEAQAAEEKAKSRDNLTLISQLKPMAKIRMALMGNAFERSVLIRDANKAVCMSAIKSPRVRENEVEKYSANRTLSHDIVRYIARRRDWTKNYSIKYQLVLNPKTPMSAAMGFLTHLRQHDVRKVARSKNIPSALATAAKRRMNQRS